MTEAPRSIVIGAGIVGLSAAFALQRDGHQVTVLDPAGPAGGASSGNAGWLSGASVVPSAFPGMLKSVPGWLTDPLGPLSLRWRHLPAAAPWLWRFIRAGTAPRIMAQAKALRQLLGPSVAAHRQLAAAVGAEHLIRQLGALWVYRTEAAFRADATGTALRRSQGVLVEELDAFAVRQLEPSLSRDIKFARFVAENGHCTDPAALCRLVADAFVRDGGQILAERVVALDRRDGRVVRVRTEQANHPADWLVLAAGAWSAPLAAQLGDRVPLESERGYHLEITEAEAMPRLPIMSGEGKFAVTPMADRLRLAGTVEFAGLAAPPDWRRADLLLRQARELFPALPADLPEHRLSRWLGHRPSTPDSLPVIGRSRRAANAVHAFGHGHVGLASGPLTGRLVADLIAGRPPAIELEPFSPGRFQMTLFRQLALSLVIALGWSPAWAATELIAAYPDAIRGPAAAHGAIIWNHGLSQEEANAKHPPPPVMEMFRDAGWDVYRLNRGIASDREEDSTQALLDAIDSLKAKGYAKLVTAGQSFGSWISLTAAGRTDKLSAVLVNAPAAYGDASKSGYERNETLLYPKLEALPHIPVMISFFNRDLYDPGGRGPKADRILTERGVPHLIIDRPAVLEGHGSGSSIYFARRFGPCWLAAAETGQVPALSSCESHWGDGPSADLKLPADLTIAPGGLAGKWYGSYSTGREVMLVVIRVDGTKAEGILATGPSTSAAAGSSPVTGQAANGALVFSGPGKPTITLTPASDGSAGLLWVSADGTNRLGAALHRVP